MQNDVDIQQLPEHASVLDLSCCFIIPGLIDTQTHLTSQPNLPPHSVRRTQWSDADRTVIAMRNAEKTLRGGFTSIRDMGHSGQSVFAVRDAINDGLIEGPRMQAAGELIRPTGGELAGWMQEEIEQALHVAAICDGPADCGRAVRASIALGADTIKVATKGDLAADSPSQFALEELIAIREAAHRKGVRVTASGFSTDSINLPLAAGFDGVVHGTYSDTETFELLRENKAWFIPTLLAARVVREMAEDPDSRRSDAWREENLSIYHGMVASFRAAMDAGVQIAFGTDAGWRPHGENAEQLEQMVELGMTPHDALLSATAHAAAAIGWDSEIGAIEPDKYADILVLKGNPLEQITLTRTPLAVIKGGSVVVDNRDD
ncbi:metal-dependent hydrolase family protein [Luminiphilus syltensis]|nr:amidohydrolase family protein [Luminiphilus syltensis]